MKLAEILERKGKSGRITFIDGAPALLKAIVSEYIKEQNDEAVQQGALLAIFSVISKASDDKFIAKCFKAPTWDEKVVALSSNEEALRLYGKEYLALMIHAIFNRIKIVLKSDVKICSAKRTVGTLIRPTTASVNSISESYDLDVNFEEKLDVKYLEGNHFSILENPELVDNLNDLHSMIEK